MNGEALADASNVESGPSSPGTSSDSDAVNTSTSRVYFGPIQPAERRLTRARDSLQNTPIRRSPRHHADSSLPMEVSQSEDGEGSLNDVMASDLSRPDTPMLTDDVLEGVCLDIKSLVGLTHTLQSHRLLLLPKSCEPGITLRHHRALMQARVHCIMKTSSYSS